MVARAPPVFLFSLAASVFSLFFFLRWCVCVGEFPIGRFLVEKLAVVRASKYLTFRILKRKSDSDEVAVKTWLFDRFPSAGVLRGSVSSAFLFLEILAWVGPFHPKQ